MNPAFSAARSKGLTVDSTDAHCWKSEPDDTNLAGAWCHLHHRQPSHSALAMLPPEL